jgi:hypothetical protein
LGHGDAAEFLDGLQAQGAVGVAAGQNDAHRALALVFGKRGKEQVYRPAALAVAGSGSNVEPSLANRNFRVLPQHIDLVYLDGHVVLHGEHRQGRVPLEDLGHVAFTVRPQVGHHDEGHAWRWRKTREKILQRFHASGRGADTYDIRSAGKGHGSWNVRNRNDIRRPWIRRQ